VRGVGAKELRASVDGTMSPRGATLDEPGGR